VLPAIPEELADGKAEGDLGTSGVSCKRPCTGAGTCPTEAEVDGALDGGSPLPPNIGEKLGRAGIEFAPVFEEEPAIEDRPVYAEVPLYDDSPA
jgi:hypothetical protein